MNKELDVSETELTANRSTELSFSDIRKIVWKAKWHILITTFVVTLLTIIYVKSLPDIYRSEATLAPSSDTNSMRLPSQLGGLAALAGVSLGGGDGDKTQLAIEILKSREFLTEFIDKNDLYVTLMATKGWDRTTNTLLIRESDYDVENKRWIRKVQDPFKPKPSALEASEKLKGMLKINTDKASGLVRISIDHVSPYVARDLARNIIDELNEKMKSIDMKEAENSIQYLQSELNKNNIAGIKTVIYSLIEEQTKTKMLANIRDEYVFRTIDPPLVAEKKSEPKRALIVCAVFFITLFFMTFVAIIRLNKKYQ